MYVPDALILSNYFYLQSIKEKKGYRRKMIEEREGNKVYICECGREFDNP